MKWLIALVVWSLFGANLWAQWKPALRIETPAEGIRAKNDTVVLNGWATPGALVQARGVGTIADSAGKWELRVPAQGQVERLLLSVVASVSGAQAEATVAVDREMAVANVEPMKAEQTPVADIADLPVVPVGGGDLRAMFFLPDAPAEIAPGVLRGILNRLKIEIAETARGVSVAFVSADSLGADRQRAISCRNPGCALEIARRHGLDVVFTGKLENQGTGYAWEISVWSALRGSTVAVVQAQTGAELSEIGAERSRVVGDIVAAIEQNWAGDLASILRVRDLYSGTPLGDTVISGVLSRDRSPYLVYGILQVPAGEQLRVESGVTLYFVPGRYGGLVVYGQLVADGTAERPVRFLSAARRPNAWDWNRILVAGNGRSSMLYAEVAHANFGIHVENSSLLLRKSVIRANSLRGLYVRNGFADVQDCRFENGHIVAIQAGALSDVNLVRTVIADNRNGLAVMRQSRVTVSFGEIERNDRGIVLLPQSSLTTEKTLVSANQAGIAAVEPIPAGLFEGLRGNTFNMQQIQEATLEAVLREPDPGDIPRYDIAREISPVRGERRAEEQWSFYGNWRSGVGYNLVHTERNGAFPVEIPGDTVAPGERFPNIFVPRGVFSDASVYWLMESMEGRGAEFQGDLRSDSWTRLRVKPFTLRYWSPSQSATVGYFQETGNPLVLSGMDVLGMRYRLAWGYHQGEEFISVDGFWGETREPLGLGVRHPDIFGQRIENGSAAAQRLSGLGRITLNPSTAWRLQLGALVNDDRKTGLWVRDDIGSETETQEPEVHARHLFGTLDWNLPRSRLGVRLEVAVGRADTADILKQRALNEVLTRAGLDSVDISAARWLFSGDERIRRADSAELALIFPAQSDLAAARDSLIKLMRLTRERESALRQEQDDDRVLGVPWDKEHQAGRLELSWKSTGHAMSLYAQYTGLHYASPGAVTLRQNSREYGVAWSQSVFAQWDVENRYSLRVENAARDSFANLFGFAESSDLGLVEDPAWDKAHRRDIGRAHYIHDVLMRQQWRWGEALEFFAEYGWEWSTQRLPTALRVNYDPAVGIYADPWFTPVSGRAVRVLDLGGGDSALVDSARWSDYERLAGISILAEGLQERVMRHALRGDVQWRLLHQVFKAGGNWIWQKDYSSFDVDSLLNRMALADTTLAKLGRHPQASAWFEHSYLVSWTTRWGAMSNRTGFAPRWRFTAIDRGKETEWSLSDRLEWGFAARRYVVALEGIWRRGVIESYGRRLDVRTDRELRMSTRINWTSRFYTEAEGRVFEARRLAAPEEENRVLSGKINLFYAF